MSHDSNFLTSSPTYKHTKNRFYFNAFNWVPLILFRYRTTEYKSMSQLGPTQRCSSTSQLNFANLVFWHRFKSNWSEGKTIISRDTHLLGAERIRYLIYTYIQYFFENFYNNISNILLFRYAADVINRIIMFIKQVSTKRVLCCLL